MCVGARRDETISKLKGAGAMPKFCFLIVSIMHSHQNTVKFIGDFILLSIKSALPRLYLHVSCLAWPVLYTVSLSKPRRYLSDFKCKFSEKFIRS